MKYYKKIKFIVRLCLKKVQGGPLVRQSPMASLVCLLEKRVSYKRISFVEKN